MPPPTPPGASQGGECMDAEGAPKAASELSGFKPWDRPVMLPMEPEEPGTGNAGASRAGTQAPATGFRAERHAGEGRSAPRPGPGPRGWRQGQQGVAIRCGKPGPHCAEGHPNLQGGVRGARGRKKPSAS